MEPKPTLRIGARSTIVRPIELDQARDFIRKHHRQGWARPGKRAVYLGLLYGEDVVAVAIFCTPRTHRKNLEYSSELLRLAFADSVRVMGGASKLIRYYQRNYSPMSLFTYQDTSGKVTDVYLKSGMELVEKARPKNILVRDGFTAASARNNYRDWFSLEQAVQRGPDSLLGTALGEVFRLDGARKSNVDLFLEDCGYHLETVPGDHVFAWHNPAYSYYCYKITSTVDDRYYIGQRKLLIANATTEDCTDDPYMGSGGTKLQAWVEEVGVNALRKEILWVGFTFGEANAKEIELIGDRFQTDPNCMNMRVGGRSSSRPNPEFLLVECPIHGISKHYSGGLCTRCVSALQLSEKTCPVHGLTTHKGDTCAQCTAEKSLSERNCPVHGSSPHQGVSCTRCSSARLLTKTICPTHGETTHQGGTCNKCASDRSITLKECPTHGETKFQGDKCAKCSVARARVGSCETHGVTTFRGSTCQKCKNQEGYSEDECDKHGLVTFRKGSCTHCHSAKAVSIRACAVHGDTKFQGDTCVKCRNGKLIQEKDCPKHGLTKHRGQTCYACTGEKRRANRLAKNASKSS